ncbi:MAG TPA: AAA family ATPase [Armatimonadota bacterium]|nr:AAA family ATPase [Armatimonadota bacterium]
MNLDELAAGGTREALEALAADTPDWAPPDAAAPAPLAVVRRLADVQPEAVMWLWPGWLPRGKLALLDGDPGLGKSLITLDLAARVSRGASMPDGAGGGEPAGVVILTAEDDLSDTVRPRLDAAGADVSKIAALAAVRRRTEGGAEVLETPTLMDLEALRQAIASVSAALVIIDPLMAYLPG